MKNEFPFHSPLSIVGGGSLEITVLIIQNRGLFQAMKLKSNKTFRFLTVVSFMCFLTFFEIN